MARALVTQAAVAAAAAQLVATGAEPSIITVQAQIGGGSFSTVKRYLDAWKAAQAVAPQPVAVPPLVAAQASAFGQTVWQAALELVEQQIAQVRAEAERQVAQARAAEAEAVQAVTHLETQLETVTAQLVAVQQERVAAQAAQAQATAAAHVATTRLEEQGHRLADLQQQVAQQAAALAQARAELLTQAQLAGEVAALRRQLTVRADSDGSARRRAGDGD